MKNIFIVRHAKSEKKLGGTDFERPLNKKGESDALMMSKRLLDSKIKVDALISSPALRTKKTAILFSETLEIPVTDIIFNAALYDARAELFYKVIADCADNFTAIAIFSHNPGVSDFVNSLNTEVTIENMPTCSIFAIQADIANWTNFFKAKKKCLFFITPKKWK